LKLVALSAEKVSNPNFDVLREHVCVCVGFQMPCAITWERMAVLMASENHQGTKPRADLGWALAQCAMGI
jgi:hypothetical protein